MHYRLYSSRCYFWYSILLVVVHALTRDVPKLQREEEGGGAGDNASEMYKAAQVMSNGSASEWITRGTQ